MSLETELAAEALREWIGDTGLMIPGLDAGVDGQLVIRVADTVVYSLAPLDDGWHAGLLSGPGPVAAEPIAALADAPEDVLRRFYEQLGVDAAAHRKAGRRKTAFTLGDFAAESAFALRFNDVAHTIQRQGLTSFR